jgi:hypothetical protein
MVWYGGTVVRWYGGTVVWYLVWYGMVRVVWLPYHTIPPYHHHTIVPFDVMMMVSSVRVLCFVLSALCQFPTHSLFCHTSSTAAARLRRQTTHRTMVVQPKATTIKTSSTNQFLVLAVKILFVLLILFLLPKLVQAVNENESS